MPFIPGSNEEETSYFRRLAATRDEYIRNLKKETEISAIRHWLDHQHHLPKISGTVCMFHYYLGPKMANFQVRPICESRRSFQLRKIHKNIQMSSAKLFSIFATATG